MILFLNGLLGQLDHDLLGGLVLFKQLFLKLVKLKVEIILLSQLIGVAEGDQVAKINYGTVTATSNIATTSFMYSKHSFHHCKLYD